jgi:hypothetical protein
MFLLFLNADVFKLDQNFQRELIIDLKISSRTIFYPATPLQIKKD